MALKTVAKLAITYNQADPADVTKWDMATFPNSIPAPGWPTHLRGPAILPFLRQFNDVILDHWPQHPMMQVMRACCQQTRFHLYVSIDAVPATPVWAGALQEFTNVVLRGFRLVGTDGQPVNVYHGVANRAPVHSVNLANLVAAGTFGSHLKIMRDNIGNHGWFSDSMSDFAFYGTAPNAPAAENRITSWATCVTQIKNANPSPAIEVWGNTFSPVSAGKYGLDVVYFEQTNAALSVADSWTLTAWTKSRLVLP